MNSFSRSGMNLDLPAAQPLHELAPIGLIHVDSNLKILRMNAVAGELLNRSPRSLIGRRLDRVYFADSRPFAVIERARAGQCTVSGWNQVFLGPDGETQQFDVHVSWQGNEGFGIAFLPSVRPGMVDTAGGLGKFAKVFGHEVRTPLAAISGAAQLLARRVGEDDAERELLDLILAESERLGRVIKRLTDFEPLREPRLRRVNVHEIIDRVIAAEELLITDGACIERDFDPSLPEIDGDPDHLHQALQNLIRNALESPLYGGFKKSVTVATAYVLGSTLASRGTVGSMEIRVSDNGAGMDEETVASAFSAFYTTKTSGSGIGLSVVQDVVTGHSGTISVRSKPGYTVFSITLPLPQSRRGDRT